MPHELFLTTRQKTKIRNTFNNNISTDVILSKSQLAKIIRSGGFLGKIIGNLGKKVLLDLLVPLVKDVLPNLATKATSSVLDKFERKTSGKGAVRAERGFTLFISNENMDDIIKIVESLERLSQLIDGATETVKHEIKNQEDRFRGAMMAPMAASLIAPMASSLMQPVSSSLASAISGKGQKGGILLLLSLKEEEEEEEEDIITWIKILSFISSFKQYY